MLRIVVIAVASLMVGNAMATCIATSCDNERILLIRTTATGDVYVKTSGDMNQLGCSLYSGAYATSLSISTPNVRESC